MEIFTLKKLASMLIMPLPAVIICLCLSSILFYLQRRKWAFYCQGLALGLLLLVATPWLPNTLLRDLEQEYHQFDLSQPVDYVVILGCGHTNDATLPITAQFQPCSLYRLVEGLRILKHNSNAKLVTSGYSKEPFSNAEMMKKLAIELGISSSRILMQTKSRDTEEEVTKLKPLIQNSSFALVTSATHMHRSMRLFQNIGLYPLAAPTEHLVRLSDKGNSDWWGYLPHSTNLNKSERYWYEVMGNTWLTLKGS
ncbi:ElyC/SanA/YdcF family protein [Alteromonadaceae bacterium BrNp21-10]|nr:ElyC/SanA/YdcF family protein [Alteromonadaceae bacterium BrNp21-10]